MSWHGELKKAVASMVCACYDLFPPKGSCLLKTETRQYMKQVAEDLIKRAAFVHGGKDNYISTHTSADYDNLLFTPCRIIPTILATQRYMNPYTSSFSVVRTTLATSVQANLGCTFSTTHSPLQSLR